MSETEELIKQIEELIKQIEELRLNMIRIQEGRSYTDPEVVAAGQELETALDKYREMIMKKADKK